jgi:endoglucanase
VLYRAKGGFAPDADTRGVGSYDAVRVYLWAALLAPEDPRRAPLLAALRPMAAATAQDGVPPARVDSAAGSREGSGPAAFSAALAPFLEASGYADAAREQMLRLQAIEPQRQGYYDQVLGLFAAGAQDGWLRFDRDGRLQPRWTAACAAAPRR